MRILSILAMIFLPISTVSSVFGTQFFTSVLPEPSGTGQGDISEARFIMDPNFFLLPAIALPLTTFSVGCWLLWEHWEGTRARLSGWWMQVLNVMELNLEPRHGHEGDIELRGGEHIEAQH
jgi:hypothetical protein